MSPILSSIIHIILLLFVLKRNRRSYSEFIQFNDYRLEEGYDSSVNNTESIPSNNFRSIANNEDSFGSLFSPKNLRSLIAGWLMHMVIHFSGVNMIIAFSYYHHVIPKSNLMNLRFIISILSVIFSFIGVYFAKRFKRKPVMLIGTIITCAWNWILFQVYEEFKTGNDTYKLTTAIVQNSIIVIFTISFALTTGPLIWVYSTEALNEKGMWIASSVNWLMFSITSSFPAISLLISDSSHQGDVTRDNIGIFFFIFSGFSMMFFFLIIAFVTETKGYTQEQIRKKFRINQYKKNGRTSSLMP